MVLFITNAIRSPVRSTGIERAGEKLAIVKITYSTTVADVEVHFDGTALITT